MIFAFNPCQVADTASLEPHYPLIQSSNVCALLIEVGEWSEVNNFHNCSQDRICFEGDEKGDPKRILQCSPPVWCIVHAPSMCRPCPHHCRASLPRAPASLPRHYALQKWTLELPLSLTRSPSPLLAPFLVPRESTDTPAIADKPSSVVAARQASLSLAECGSGPLAPHLAILHPRCPSSIVCHRAATAAGAVPLVPHD